MFDHELQHLLAQDDGGIPIVLDPVSGDGRITPKWLLLTALWAVLTFARRPRRDKAPEGCGCSDCECEQDA